MSIAFVIYNPHKALTSTTPGLIGQYDPYARAKDAGGGVLGSPGGEALRTADHLPGRPIRMPETVSRVPAKRACVAHVY